MKVNVFAQHPAGFRVHFEIDDARLPDDEEMGMTGTVNKLAGALGALTKWMVEHGYSGEYANGTAPAAPTATPPPSGGPPCEVCGGPTEFKTGKSKTGGIWKAWACLKTKDAPRNAKHPFMWVDD